MADESTAANRLRRKLKQRDQRIAGLNRRIEQLEQALASRVLDAKQMPREITKAVQDALCNVRMIPVFGGRVSRIDVREVSGDADSAAALSATVEKP